MTAEALWPALLALVPAVITILVFSRLFGDNPLFRFAQYLFVGMSLGYAFVVTYHQVLRPAVLGVLAAQNNSVLLSIHLTPFGLGLLLLTRLLGGQKLSWLANIPLAFIFGVSAALALSGALVGTLLPQLVDSIRPLKGSPLEIGGNIFLPLGIIIALSSFTFAQPKNPVLAQIQLFSAHLGRWLLGLTFGFFLAGALLTYLTALNERLEFLIQTIRILSHK